METRNNVRLILACLCLSLPVTGVQAQQSYNPGWASYAGGNYDWDGVRAVIADSQTNTFFGGYLGYGGINLRNNNGVAATQQLPYTLNSGGDDGFVAKLTGSGSLAWYICLGTDENDLITGLAVHTNGTLYAAGFFARTVDVDDAGTDASLTSLAGASGHVNWSQSIGNFNGNNGFNAVAVDSNGYIYAVGYTTVTNLSNPVAGYSANGSIYGHAYKGNTDAVVMKFAPSNGSVVWSCYLGGTNADTATALAVAADGSVYVGGETHSPGWASLSSRTPSPSNSDAFLVKLTASGTHVWSALLGGNAADAVTAIANVPASSVFFLGGSTASSDFLSSATRLNAFSGGTDGFVVKLTDTGTSFQTNWCRFFGGNTADRVSALTPQALGSVVAGGTTASGTWLTHAGSSSFGGVQDGFLSLLSSDGSVSWSTYVGGARSDELHALSSVSTTLLTGGITYSPDNVTDWVSGGFWPDWTKEDWGDGIPNYDATLSYGFVAQWSTQPGVAPSITDEPHDVTAHEGSPAAFSVTAAGTAPLTYRWLRNGAIVTGLASTNAYALAAAARTNNSDTYACLVSNAYGTATSRAAKLTVISNGTLTVTLTPAVAVAQGARWSIDSGATWFVSGSGTNVWPGAYTVTFASITGWTAPATRSNVQVAAGATPSISCVYTAVLPAAARTIAGTNVSVSVQAPAGLSAWSLVETLQAGLTPTNILGGGVWNAAAHTLTFTGSEAYTGTVSYLVICSASGIYTVTGSVTASSSGQSVAVTGDSRIIRANLYRTISGTNVTITVYQPSSTRRWWVDETLPLELTPGSMTGPEPTWDPDAHVLDFYKNRGVGETLTYAVSGIPGTYILSGSGNVTGSDEPVLGDTVLIIPSAQPADIPRPDILSFTPVAGTGTYALSFTSVVNQAYAILTNATVRATNNWVLCLPVTGSAGVTLRQVPVGGTNLFYRVRVAQ